MSPMAAEPARPGRKSLELREDLAAARAAAAPVHQDLKGRATPVARAGYASLPAAAAQADQAATAALGGLVSRSPPRLSAARDWHVTLRAKSSATAAVAAAAAVTAARAQAALARMAAATAPTTMAELAVMVWTDSAQVAAGLDTHFLLQTANRADAAVRAS